MNNFVFTDKEVNKFKNRHKGARQIKMVLEKEFGIKFNLKKYED